MDSLFPDWSEFLSLLLAHEVRFLLIGGHAVALHATPRYTEDLDVFVEATNANARKLRSALVDFGFASLAPARRPQNERNAPCRSGNDDMRAAHLMGGGGAERSTRLRAVLRRIG
jgi:hypothetical protein